MVSLLGVFGQGRRTTDAVLQIVGDLGPSSVVDTLRKPMEQRLESFEEDLGDLETVPRHMMSGPIGGHRVGASGRSPPGLGGDLDNLRVGLALICQLDDPLGVAAHGFGCAFKDLADERTARGRAVLVNALNTGTAAMN